MCEEFDYAMGSYLIREHATQSAGATGEAPRPAVEPVAILARGDRSDPFPSSLKAFGRMVRRIRFRRVFEPRSA